MQIILSGLIPLFVYHLRLPACMISLIRRLFLFLFFFWSGSVRFDNVGYVLRLFVYFTAVM